MSTLRYGGAASTSEVRTADRTRARKIRRNTGIRLLFLLPAVVYLLGIFLVPVIYNLVMSFKNYTAASINGDAPFIGFQNYVQLFHMPVMGKTLINTIEFVVGSIVFQSIIGMALALLFNRKFPLSRLLRTLMLIPWLLPLIVSGTAFKWIFDQNHGVLNAVLMHLHIIHSPLGWLVSPNLALISVIITNIWVGIPFNMVLYHSGLQNIPEELYEAAALDGCNKWQQFWRITIPSLKSVIAIVLMLGLIYTLKVFDVIMVLTGGGPANASQILSTWSYDLSFQNMQFGQGAAVGNIMIAISLIFCFIYMRATRQSEVN
ncbi:carbohydrate ABC transporter permease [Alicyclobacillus herbarius]|uniref:carbohydrate ABC transporter permease n=1 Tax=Alicyclobacillus herbarius TaxID=122960 RepID=UPI00040AA160|nr:sugar ABC transporter permease [Alicyclobacillus herbarius]